MNILITGSSGFIGKSVLEKLSKSNNNILCINRSKQKYKDNNINQIICSIESIKGKINYIKKFKPEIIINLAWSNIPNYDLKNSVLNLKNSISFFSEISKLPTVRKIINTGSCWEAGKKFGKLSPEIWNPENHFTWAKYALYKWLLLLKLTKQIDIVWLRLFYVYGPHQNYHSLIPTLYLNLIKKRPKMNIRTPYDSVDFIYVDDCSTAILKSCSNKIKTEIFNIGSGKATNIFRICNKVENKILGSSINTNKIKKNNKNKINNNFSANINKTYQILNWKPKIQLDEGLNKTISYFKNI